MTTRFPTPNFPDLDWPLTKPMVRAIAKMVRQFRDLFNRRISYDLHLASRFVEIEFRAGGTSTPRKRVPELKCKPAGVMVLDFVRISGVPGPAQMAQPLSWSFVGDSIVLDSFAGFAGSETYRIRLLVVEG